MSFKIPGNQLSFTPHLRPPRPEGGGRFHTAPPASPLQARHTRRPHAAPSPAAEAEGSGDTASWGSRPGREGGAGRGGGGRDAGRAVGRGRPSSWLARGGAGSGRAAEPGRRPAAQEEGGGGATGRAAAPQDPAPLPGPGAIGGGGAGRAGMAETSAPTAAGAETSSEEPARGGQRPGHAPSGGADLEGEAGPPPASPGGQSEPGSPVAAPFFLLYPGDGGTGFAARPPPQQPRAWRTPPSPGSPLPFLLLSYPGGGGGKHREWRRGAGGALGKHPSRARGRRVRAPTVYRQVSPGRGLRPGAASPPLPSARVPDPVPGRGPSRRRGGAGTPSAGSQVGVAAAPLPPGRPPRCGTCFRGFRGARSTVQTRPRSGSGRRNPGRARGGRQGMAASEGHLPALSFGWKRPPPSKTAVTGAPGPAGPTVCSFSTDVYCRLCEQDSWKSVTSTLKRRGLTRENVDTEDTRHDVHVNAKCFAV